MIDTPPLPGRLRIERRIDNAACWLVNHGHYRLAEYLWRACRLW